MKYPTDFSQNLLGALYRSGIGVLNFRKMKKKTTKRSDQVGGVQNSSYLTAGTINRAFNIVLKCGQNGAELPFLKILIILDGADN